jgi:hypothetical protein
MFDVFQDTPDLTPFEHVPAAIPLDQGPGLAGTKSAAVGPLQKAWFDATAEVMKDKITKADAADPNFLNHVVWYSATGWKLPYPGERKILSPEPFLKAARAYHDHDGDD